MRIIIALAFCLVFRESISQNYTPLLNSNQRAEVLQKSRNNKGVGTFNYEVNSNTKVFFVYADSILITEGVSVMNKLQGLVYTYKNGLLTSIYNYEMDCLSGYCFDYFSNGTIMSFGRYSCLSKDTSIKNCTLVENKSTGMKDTVITYSNTYSTKDGTWYYFNNKGVILCQENLECRQVNC